MRTTRIPRGGRWLVGIPLAAVAIFCVPSVAHAGPGTRTTNLNAAEQSNNWSGYGTNVTETGLTGLYKSVSGDWVVPQVSAHTAGSPAYTSDWIGIGGNTLVSGQPTGDPLLIQTGTEQDVNADGSTQYDVWWEILPEPETQITTMTVSPGDHMHADISEGSVPGLWTITIKDLTNGGSFTTTTPYPSLMETAEWVHEAPTLIGTNAGVGTLANSAPIHFSGAAINGSPVNLNNADQIQMTDSNGNVIAQPSAPDSTGSGFDVCVYSGTTCS